jgi:hypothetical protein
MYLRAKIQAMRTQRPHASCVLPLLEMLLERLKMSSASMFSSLTDSSYSFEMEHGKRA